MVLGMNDAKHNSGYLKKVAKLNNSSYYRIFNLLKSLRIRYKELNVEDKNYHLVVEDFGIVVRFNLAQPMSSYGGWDLLDFSPEAYEDNSMEFVENFMWLLIAKGYLAYLRNGESGDSRMFKQILIDNGWADKIMRKRLELYGNEPRHNFMIEFNKRMMELPINYVVMHYPSFFDYLWCSYAGN